MYDVVIIGAGVVGGFVARNLAKYEWKVALLEKHSDVCNEATKANSAIVHSGYNGKPGAIKTGMTIRANANFHNVCEELDVKFQRCGSLMVATDKKGEKKVRDKYKRGLANQIPDIQLISGAEALAIEPNLNPEVTIALYAPTTGIVNPWEFGIAAIENAVDNGVELFLDSEVQGLVRRKDGYYQIITSKQEFVTKYVINCGGLYSHDIHNMIAKPFFKIAPRRGEYIVLDKGTNHMSHVVFQGRGEDSPKGVIVVPTVDGNILVGPSTEDVYGDYNVKTSREKLEGIRAVAGNSIQNLPFEKTIRTFAGIRPRPQLYGVNPETGEAEYFEDDVKDFILGEPEDAPNFFNCAGTKSPALTCADEIGKYVEEWFKNKEKLVEKAEYNPRRRPLIRFNEMRPEDRAVFMEENPEYGRIVCRCQQVTEAEIVDVIHRSAGATTIDGVKRRAGSSLGRCQGGFCTSEVMKILARELGVKAEAIIKQEAGSYVVRGEK